MRIIFFAYICAMNNDRLCSAEFIKAQIIDFLITSFPYILFIGNEVMYGTKRKVTDLLICKDNELIAIEIKSDNDNLLRLEEQINESRKVFDYVVVCTTYVHFKKIRKILAKDVGVYIVTDNGIKVYREPKKHIRLNKEEMLYSMSSFFLRRHLDTKGLNFNSDEVRLRYLEKTLKEIRNLLIYYMKLKIQSKFRLFIQDRGESTLLDDIPILSSPLFIK